MHPKLIQYLAQHLSDLEHNLKSTNRAKDRQLWEKYLADAATIMWRVILHSPQEEIIEAIASHEHLLGWSYIAGPVDWNYPESYEKFKKMAGYVRNE